MDFYAEKGSDLPRFIYRNLFEAMDRCADAEQRREWLQAFCTFVNELEPHGDWHKLKWCLPRHDARFNLTEAEAAEVEKALETRRSGRDAIHRKVYPHCSDEYSLSLDFLDAVFGDKPFKVIDRQTRIFTIGSCFARNIARYLQQKGFCVTPFVQTEDINSPFSNAKMLSVCIAPEDERRSYIERWVRQLYGDEADLPAIAQAELGKLDDLHDNLRQSDFMIVTCGNVIDYFLDGADPSETLAVAPKFLSISNSEDVTHRRALARKLKEAGSRFRMGSYEEVARALESLYQTIKAINPHAYLLFTLSPIPIDSAIGLEVPDEMSAVEIDAISKSMLRVALNDLLARHRDDFRLRYFPSFEMVRWIAPNLEGAAFGREDATSRHVSQRLLSGVCNYFIHKYCHAA